jgi:hypothetical protein
MGKRTKGKGPIMEPEGLKVIEDAMVRKIMCAVTDGQEQLFRMAKGVMYIKDVEMRLTFHQQIDQTDGTRRVNFVLVSPTFSYGVQKPEEKKGGGQNDNAENPTERG